MGLARGAAAAAAFLLTVPAQADDLEALGRDFWTWRAATQPLSGDDIPRIDRPPGWVPDWSVASVAGQRRALAAFEARFRALDVSSWPIPKQVDHRLIGSALARVRWELDVTAGWQRNPLFYVQQTLGAIFDRLLPPPPFDPVRASEIVRRMESIPRTVEQAKANLTDARAPFARLAVEDLAQVRVRLSTVARELAPLLPAAEAAALSPATEKAIAALESYGTWLEARLPTLNAETAVGRDDYAFFLREVALLPYAPERLVEMGRQEWERAVAFEAYEKNRNLGSPSLTLPVSSAEQMAWMSRDIPAVRRFLEAQRIQTVPAWVKPYRLQPMPAYLEPLAGLGVDNDLTGPTRLGDDGTSWIRQPSPALGYFDRVYALDPRIQIAHEGNGHHLQLCLSWAQEDPIRRHYYDSGPNEGIAFYNEELMVQAGLFDASPQACLMLYNMMRLRALRVEVDVKLATGVFTIEQATDYLRTMVPMDRDTARAEAAFFATGPGQAITYQIGKLQILAFLADARLAQGDAFDLRAFHDFLWKNGNVPLVLQRWEYLGTRDQVDALKSVR